MNWLKFVVIVLYVCIVGFISGKERDENYNWKIMIDEVSNKSLFSYYFLNIRGRIGRKEFNILFLPTLIVTFLLSAFFFMYVLHDPFGLGVVSVFIMIACAFIGIVFGIKRLHDLGKTTGLLCLAIIPIANFYLLYLLIAATFNPSLSPKSF